MRPSYIILHCSATVDGRTFSWDAIRKYHMEDPDHLWSDIGYHYGLEQVEDGLMLMQGRPPWLEGAHCKAGGRNHDSVGFCVVGNYDTDPPDVRRYRSTIQALAALCWALKINPVNVCGHREFESAKTCPGTQWNMTRVRTDVAVLFDQIGDDTILPVGEVFHG